jgi:hypothetical protein
MKHSSPYIELYMNGTSQATYTSGDWTNPTWGTYFWMGSNNNTTGDSQLDGTIKRIVKYSRALTEPEVSSVTTILQNS